MTDQMVPAARLRAGLLASEARISQSDPHLCPCCQQPIWRGQREALLPDGRNWCHIWCLGGGGR